MIPRLRDDFLDFPTAWRLQRAVGADLAHQPRCSSVPGWDPISGPAFLCDCGALTSEWERRCEIQRETHPAQAPAGSGRVETA